MRIFLSYSSRDRQLAETIDLALRGQRHQVFFDRRELAAGEEYDARIRRAIERSQLFIFLVSPDSLRDDSYARTELAIAQKAWDHPAGRVLPVIIRHVELEQLPAYMKSVTLLEPAGNLPAAVAHAVHRLAAERRKRVLIRLAAALALGGLLGLGGYAYLTRGLGATTTGDDGARSVLVATGAFTMGDGEIAPLREIHLDAFYIDEYEVTVSRYARFLEEKSGVDVPEGWPPEDLDRAADLPVVGVDWHDADEYCRWAGRRLPTEAEWEKAARGADQRTYPWGNDEPTRAHAQFGGSASHDAYTEGLARVGSHAAGRGPYGAYDMAGNVNEWVADWHAEGLESADVRNPRGPTEGSAKVIRGGGWYDPPERLASARRVYASPPTRLDDVGFRCARDARRSG